MGVANTNIEQLSAELDSALACVTAKEDLELLRRDWLGKEGTIKKLFKEMGGLTAEERPPFAAKLNALKEKLESFIETRTKQFEQGALSKQLESQFVDLSLPAHASGSGLLHPITRVERALISALRHYGLKIAYGPEIETEYFCFDSLNIPKHHPARDMQDTFYTANGQVLRTHTTSVQARVLKKGGAPVKILSPGRVYRNESSDAWHTSMFHQFELIWVDKGLTLSHLMGIMALVAKELYGPRRKIRFKPKYYPYTEPSLGLDVALTSKESKEGETQGWVTVVGAGMVHRKVLQEFGYDPKVVSGIAFGFGTSRLAVERFKLRDARALYENDLRVFKEIR